MQISMIGLGRMGGELFSSQGEADFADRVLSAMHYGFGGHLEKTAATTGGA